jgi:hypothetical protein
MPCRPGTIGSTPRAETCANCPAGKFQSLYSQLACNVCPSGFYCERGTAKPTPCPGGTSSAALGATSVAACAPVQPGFWAPTGSASPKPCPATGFYCPGAAADSEFGGAEPIIVTQGGATEKVEVEEEVEEILQSLTLDADLETFDRAAFIRTIAAQYGVAASSITLDLTAGSIQVEFKITIPTAADSSGSAAVVVAAINAVDASTLTAALGVSVLSTSSPKVQTTTRTVTRYQEKTCPRGFWCTAGLEIPCEAGFFNPTQNANNQSACIRCPKDSTTLGPNSTGSELCACNEGFYNPESTSSRLDCKPCFAGTDCERARDRTYPCASS